MGQDGLVSHELVSALADGELAGEEFATVLATLADSEGARAAWHAYHVVGDSLRSPELADARGDLAFVERLRGRLFVSGADTRPAMPADMTAVSTSAAASLPGAATPGSIERQSANDAVARWKLFAGLASVVAVAAIGWQLAGLGSAGAGAQLAASPGSPATTAVSGAQAGAAGMAEPPVMLRDARLDELLAAHKQFGGTSALQMPAGFLRNATFENPGR